jgi:hypothetical protein
MPLKRRRKRIKARGKFHAHGADPTKEYRRKRTDYQVLAHAEMHRQSRLRNRTAGELMFADILRALDVWFVPETIFQNGDRYILVDFYLPAHKLAVEIDGSSHDDRGEYDAGRDKWLEAHHRVRTIRFTNGDVNEALRLKTRMACGCGGQKRVGKPEIPLANAASKPIPQDLTSMAERAGMWTPERRFAGVR